jgi:hypothetical protein
MHKQIMIIKHQHQHQQQAALASAALVITLSVRGILHEWSRSSALVMSE